MEQGSTVPRRQLGRNLKTLREEAHISMAGAAKALEWSAPRIWRIETGQVSMRPTDVGVMCDLYRAGPEVTEALKALARETKARGWYHAYGEVIPSWFEVFIGLEAAAVNLRQFETDLVPGLLQTRNYINALAEIDRPTLSPEERERRIEVKLGRQALLSRRLPVAPNLEIILSETILRRPLGNSRHVMAEQLRHIVVSAKRHNVSVRVLPLSAGLYRGILAGSFTILDFPQDVSHPEPTTVYSEGFTGALYLDKESEVAAYQEIWRKIVDLALDDSDSLQAILMAAKEFDSE